MSNYKSNLLLQIANINNLKSAWSRVYDNRGCAGVDGESIHDFQKAQRGNLRILANEFLEEAYHPYPLIRILVDKGNGEARALCIPAVRDRVAQAAVLNVLGPVFEAEFEECSFAYRKGRSVRQAAQRVREYYEQGYRWVLDADVDAFFDNVSHKRLLHKVKQIVKDLKVLRLIELWIRAEVWDGNEISTLSRGIPQGSVISPMLANLYLDELDEALLQKGLQLVRYADDFLVLCKTEEKLQEAVALTEYILERMELELDEIDTIQFEQGFRFLGLIFFNGEIFKPFDTHKRIKRVIFIPPPLDINAYLSGLRAKVARI